MADTITTTVVFNDSRRLALLITNLSDGTGQSAAVLVDVSAYSATSVKIERITYNCAGMGLSILEDAGTDVKLLTLNAVAASVSGCLDFSAYGGIANSKATDYTGDLLITTTGHTAGDSYCLFLEMIKVPA